MSAAMPPARLTKRSAEAPLAESLRHCGIGMRRAGSETLAAIWSARKSAQVFKKAGAVCPRAPEDI